MEIEIVSPDKRLFKGKANLVQVPGKNGSFEVLKNHAPIVSALSKGSVKVGISGNDFEYFDIKGGVIEVNNNKIIVLVET